MRKLVMLAREITKKEISLGIGSENSSTRLSPIFKTLHMNVPIIDGKIFKPTIPIDPTQGMPLVQVPLLFVPHDESYIFATPSIIEKIDSLTPKPTNMISDPGKGTGSPMFAAAIESEDDDILILTPCDQYQSPVVTAGVKTIIKKIEDGKYQCGTILATETHKPVFTYFRVKEDRIVEYLLKGVVPEKDMFADTMIVCCKVSYLKQQVQKKRNASFEELQKLYNYPEKEIKRIQELIEKIAELLDSCKTAKEYMEKCSFCDFSKHIHILLMPEMTYAKVAYKTEWDDLGDWIKIYHSPLFPKDTNGNVVFSQEKLLLYKDCENSLIANFTDQKVIVNGLKNRIFAIGPRGAIDLPIDRDPKYFKEDVIEVKM
ncbi:MAG: hypothetical protein ACTSPK_02210 [Candidatus Heimdallarchaeota archaeon]